MSYFECCHYCKAPKRYPGCHGHCPEYIEQKKLWDARKEAEQEAKRADLAISYARNTALRKYTRSYKHKR